METMEHLLLFTGVKRSRKNLRAHLTFVETDYYGHVTVIKTDLDCRLLF